MKENNNILKIFIITLIAVLNCNSNVAKAGARPLSLIRDTEIENTLHSWGEPIFKAANLDSNSINIIFQ